MKKRFWTLVLATLAFSATALADLPNSGVQVAMVESYTDAIFIHLKSNVVDKPACAQYQTIIGCSLSKPYCAQIFSLALAAKLSSKTVEFQLETTCINGGTIAEVKRLRLQ